MNNRISIIINTLNEEKNIELCISSVRNFADEIIVCDMHSEDHTVEIAKRMGAVIVYYDRTGFVEPARYFAISQAKYNWILVVDADERLTDNLAQRLKELSNDEELEVVTFAFLYEYFGGFVYNGGFFDNNYPRFFRKGFYLETYTNEDAQIHNNFRSMVKKSKRLVTLPKNYYMLHLAYPTIEKYVIKTIGRYAILEAEENVLLKKDFKLMKLIFSPIKTFLSCFFSKQGYRDGVRGFILSVLYSIYRFTVHANMWYLQEVQKKDTITK